MAYGTHDLPYVDLGPQLTLDRALALSTRNGVSFDSILRGANAAMASVTSNVHPLVSALTYQTDQDVAGSEDGGTFQIQYGSEYAVAQPQRLEHIEHMLPYRKYDAATQFTEDFLDNASPERIAAVLDAMATGYRRLHLALTLDTLFNPAATTLNENSTTTSPKFVGYDAVNDPAYGKLTLQDGTVITAGYTHYIRDTTANISVAIDAAITKLKARGAVGPFEIFPSTAAATAIQAMSDFVWAGAAYVRPAQGTAEALVPTDTYDGVIQRRDILVRKPITQIVDGGVPYFAVVKREGDNAPGNPLRWRYLPKYGLTPVIRSRSMYPLDYATTVHRSGFGVGNRFGAALVKLSASGNYTAPTIQGL